MEKLLFIGVIIMLFSPNNIQAQSKSLKIELVKAVFNAALTSPNLDTLSGDLYQIQIDSTTILWSESFRFGKVWLKGDPTGFTFRHNRNNWVFLVDDSVEQRLEAIDEPYFIEIIKKIKKKK